jgi:hypothetical protein
MILAHLIWEDEEENNLKYLKNKEQIQYPLKDISLNFQKDNLYQANTLMSVLKSLAVSQIARL